MEVLKTVKRAQTIVANLAECREFVTANKPKRAEIERLMAELQSLEESLLAKNPLLLASLGQPTVAASTFASPQTLQQFRVFVDQQKGVSLPRAVLKQEAVSRGLSPAAAVSSVQQMQRQETLVQIEAIASHMLPEMRSLFYGQQTTASQLLDLVRRRVQGNLTVPSTLVEPVAQLIMQQLKFESAV